jgi:glycerol uptake facilitator-like aquaporin
MFVTFKQLNPVRFVFYFLVQLAGAFFGAAVAFLVYCGSV